MNIVEQENKEIIKNISKLKEEINMKEGNILPVIFLAYLYYLSGNNVHIITSNDEMAKKCKEYIEKIFSFSGVETSLIYNKIKLQEKKMAYNCDIICGAYNEFMCDYLKDNIALNEEQLVQQNKLSYAIMCGIDWNFIYNEKPIEITRETSGNEYYYIKANAFVRRLKGKILTNIDNRDEENFDYIVDLSNNSVSLTNKGIKKAEENFEMQNYNDSKNFKLAKFINNALIAHELLEKDRDYTIKNGKLYLLDTTIYHKNEEEKNDNGLQQALEAKEHICISKENKKMATIKISDYLKLYDKVVEVKEHVNYFENKINLENEDLLAEFQKELFEERKKILLEDNLKHEIFEVINLLCRRITENYYSGKKLNKIESALIKRFKMNDYLPKDKKAFSSRLENLIKAQYKKNEQIIGEKQMRDLEKETMLREMDEKWIMYLEENQYGRISQLENNQMIESFILDIKEKTAIKLLFAKKKETCKNLS